MSDYAIIAIFAAIMFAVIYIMLNHIMGSVEYHSRLERVAGGKFAEARGGGGTNGGIDWKQVFSAWAEKMNATFRFEASSGVVAVRTKLYRAGFRADNHLSIFMCIKYFGTIAVLVIMFLWHFIENDGLFVANSNAIYICVAGIMYFVGIDFVLSKIVEKRMTSIAESLPDCLDLLVVCTEAGLSLDAALQRVSSEMRRQSAVLSEEFHVTVLELGFLPERRMALENLSNRIGNDSVKSLVNTLVQSERYGTPLSSALRVISNELRDKRITMAEEKAARLPAILTVPMIVFILPTLFIVLAGPAFIDVYDSMK